MNAWNGRVFWFNVLCLTAIFIMWCGQPSQAQERLSVKEGVVGYRGDGTGVYPKETAPTGWDLATGKGVVWKTPMPDRSAGGVIVVGKRVFTQSEPDNVLCLDAADGKILWQKTCDRFALLGEKGAAVREAFLRTRGYTGGHNEFFRSPEVEAFRSVWKEAGKDPRQFWLDSPHAGAQYTACTPCSDGHRVYVKMVSGAVAAYDLDGNELWKIADDGVAGSWSNPVLYEGRLYLQRNKEGLLVLDAATGKTVTEVPKISAGAGGWGTPMIARIAGVPRLLSAGGQIVDLQTGAVLAQTAPAAQHTSLTVTPHPTQPNTSLIFANQGEVYSKNKAHIVAFSVVQSNETVTATELWRQPEITGNCFPIVVWRDWLVVCNGQRLVCFGLLDGAIKTEAPKLNLNSSCHHPIPGLSVVGDILVVAAHNGNLVGLRRGDGGLVEVFRQVLPASDPKKPDEILGTPFFSGNRMYVRSGRNMYCIGAGNTP